MTGNEITNEFRNRLFTLRVGSPIQMIYPSNPEREIVYRIDFDENGSVGWVYTGARAPGTVLTRHEFTGTTVVQDLIPAEKILEPDFIDLLRSANAKFDINGKSIPG